VAVQVIPDLHGRQPPHLGIRPCSEPPGGLRPELDFHGRRVCPQGLGVRVGGKKIHPLQVVGDHRVDGVSPAATNADHLDFCRGHAQ
jgi:hypothetical protein